MYAYMHLHIIIQTDSLCDLQCNSTFHWITQHMCILHVHDIHMYMYMYMYMYVKLFLSTEKVPNMTCSDNTQVLQL